MIASRPAVLEFPLYHTSAVLGSVAAIVCGLIVRLIPNAERPECLARKAQPVRAEPVVNLDQDARFRGMAAKDSVHRVLDMPDEVCCVIELKRYFHFIIQMQRRTLR